MRIHFVLVVAFLALAASACASPPPLSPDGGEVAMNDGRSIEHCTTLGIVSAKVRYVPLSVSTKPVDRFLTPTLRNETAQRGGNYVEAMPAQCSHDEGCGESGVAYRCPS